MFSGLMDIAPSLMAAKLTSVPCAESVAASTPVAGPLTPSRARRSSTSPTANLIPFRDIRSVDDNDVSADLLELGHQLRAPDDVDGLRAARFRESDHPPPDTGIGVGDTRFRRLPSEAGIAITLSRRAQGCERTLYGIQLAPAAGSNPQ